MIDIVIFLVLVAAVVLIVQYLGAPAKIVNVLWVVWAVLAIIYAIRYLFGAP